MNFFLCSGLDPQDLLNVPPKVNIILIGSMAMSVVLHITVRIKISVFKRKTHPEHISIESNLTSKFLKNFENQSLSDFATNIFSVIMMGNGVIIISIINNFIPANLNVYPNYYYVYVLHLYGPMAFGGFLTLAYYFKHKPLRIFIRKESQALLKDVTNEFNNLIHKT